MVRAEDSNRKVQASIGCFFISSLGEVFYLYHQYCGICATIVVVLLLYASCKWCPDAQETGLLLLQQTQSTLDSSVGRAEDCRWINAGILRSLVQIRLKGRLLCNSLLFLGFANNWGYHSGRNQMMKYASVIVFFTNFAALEAAPCTIQQSDGT